MSRRPNFLVFITDQQRADHLGCYGDPLVRTPHIDSLAASGWAFDEFHVAIPICMPNRASLFTGRMPSAHGVRHNGIELSFAERTLPQALRESGYRTAHVGKSHLQNIEIKPASYPKAGERRLRHEARSEPAGVHGQEIWKRWADDPTADVVTPYYGFETVDLSIHHADDQFGHWRQWLRAQTPDADRLIGPENAIPTPEFALTRIRQAWRTRVPEELYPTAWIADRTIARLREIAVGDDPFFLYCSFPDPHHPFTPPGRYWDMYRPDDVTLPGSFLGRHRNLPPHVQWLYDRRDDGTAVKNTQALFACSEREAREAIALNYGSISCIDDAIGRVLASLAELGLADDTVVIFTSDHGDFLGAHQLMLKGPIHYRSLTRVPFVWCDPGMRAHGRSNALTQTIDIAPTILERAGVDPWNGMQGRSLLALMHRRVDRVRDALLIEEEVQRSYLGFEQRPRVRTLLDGRYRLSLYDTVEWGELYDRHEDPEELVNLWSDPGAHAPRAELTERLVRTILHMSETSPYPTQIA